ncbi:hypothetical protein F7725_005841 [Dissostichus mawsoni]|uniref:Lipopolysaccharide-responsive and beige-like anchor protein n=1 Tax=Dissostichus mawsoni TaxID=36200 RepID=A0A7J5YSM0_DISMA|nr:hypothetical protein F7725_005841 [Dissostichus mawsoni]
MKDHGVKEDELQSILNYLLTMHEDDNLMDVLQLLVAVMSEQPGSMVQAFDQRNGIRVIYKLLGSKSEGIRVQTLKVMGYFLKHLPPKRKPEVMMSHGLFSLLTERLMLHSGKFTMTTYNVLFEILTEQICTQVIHKQHPDPDSTVKILNPQILKVIAALLKASPPSPESMEVRKVFLSDMIKLFNNSRENRRSLLQCSVWQEWMLSLCYIHPQNSEEQKITEMVYAIFRILLYHAIKYEWGGWRVWVDTLSITHSKVTFEQHKENLSHMFRQYQHQESTGSMSSIRTISGVSQRSDTMECVNGTPAEETAPSTVIELTVDELSHKSPDTASGSTITSSPPEAAEGSGHASITMSNILARDDEEEEEEQQQQVVEESSKDGSGDEGKETVSQTDDKEEQSDETNKEEQETSTDKSSDDLQTSVSEADDTDATEGVRDSATPSASDDAQTSATDDDKSEPIKGESSTSTPEDSLNEADTEVPEVSEQDDNKDQMSPESAACLENSVQGGDSVFNEDLADMSSVSDQIPPSDADDSQEESSYASAVAGEEGEVRQKEEAKDDDDEGKEDNQEGQEIKTDEDSDDKQEVELQETVEEESEADEKQVSGLESETSLTETPEQNQQPSDTTPTSTAQEVPAASDPPSPSQPLETTSTTEEETLPAPTDSSAAASTSDAQKTADPVSKTKEIKIARLDVSNVALDTERLELKETSTTPPAAAAAAAAAAGGSAGQQREGSTPAPRSTMFRIPEFRWSHMHQRLLADLLFSIETDVQMWRSHSTKTILDFVNSSENVVFVHNSIHIISQVVDNLIMACGGILPLLSAATSSSHELENIEPSQGLTVEASVTFLHRLINLVDVLIFASSLTFTEIEAEKNMSSGGILRQCLRLVCAMAVRNCLECQQAQCSHGAEASARSYTAMPNMGAAMSAAAQAMTGGMSPVRDLDRLLQDMDINRLRAVVFRDIEDSKQAQFLALAVVYFISVLMVSKYRDILEPQNERKRPQRSQSSRSTDSGAISGGLEVENGVSLRRYDSGIGDDHTSTAASEADLSSSGVTHGPDAISEALSTLSSEVRPSLPTDSKGKNVKDILRSLVSAPADDMMVDPSLLPPTFLGSVGDVARDSSRQFRSFDRSVVVAPKKTGMAPSAGASTSVPSATAASVSAGTPIDSVAMVSSGDASQSTSAAKRLENALEKAAPLLREIFVDFAPFLSRTLLGSHGQELLIEGTSLMCMKSSSSVVELEWQNSIQKNAGLAFIELVNEGRLLSHTMKDHLVRVANEAEFILSRQRAEDIHKHAEFESNCAQYAAEKRDEEKMCDHLIRAAKYRDHVTATQLVQKIVNILTDKHGAWGSSAKSPDKRHPAGLEMSLEWKHVPQNRPREFWRLDYWEDDLRRRRRFIRNPSGSTHSEATLKAAAEHASEEDILKGKQSIRSQALGNQNSESETSLDGDDDTLSSPEEKDLENFTGPVNLSTSAQLVAPAVVVKGTLSITPSELYFEVDEDDPSFKAIDPKVRDPSSIHVSYCQRIEAMSICAGKCFMQAGEYMSYSSMTTSVVKLLGLHPSLLLLFASANSHGHQGRPSAAAANHKEPWQQELSLNLKSKICLNWLQRALGGFVSTVMRVLIGPQAQAENRPLDSEGEAVLSWLPKPQLVPLLSLPLMSSFTSTLILSYTEGLHGKWLFTEIRAVFSRRYLLQNTSLEIFMANRTAVMFNFPDAATVKKVVHSLPRRTFNDLNQYPVFPWVITNYDSEELDLTLPSNFRDLSKPIGALNPKRAAFFSDRYESWEDDQVPKFHYGTHYSPPASP